MAFLRRMNASHLSLRKRMFLAALGFGLWAFVVYVNWFAAPADLRFIGSRHLDKIAHFAGGVLLAAVAEWRAPRIGLLRFFAAFLVIAIAWEAVEFSFDPATRSFYAMFPDLWRLDVAGDLFAALLGSYGYWVFDMRRSGRARINTRNNADPRESA